MEKMKALRKKLAAKGGFTLVELIVVIAILAILAAVAVPAYTGYISKAKEAADYTELDAIKTAAIVAYTDKHTTGTVGEITKIVVTSGNTASVTVTAGGSDESVTLSPYYTNSAYKFQSGKTTATWTATTTTTTGSGSSAVTTTTDASWKLS